MHPTTRETTDAVELTCVTSTFVADQESVVALVGGEEHCRLGSGQRHCETLPPLSDSLHYWPPRSIRQHYRSAAVEINPASR